MAWTPAFAGVTSLLARPYRIPTEIDTKSGRLRAKEGEMNKRKLMVGLSLLMIVALLLAGCEGYTEMNARTAEHHDGGGGKVTVGMGKANGTSTKTLETAASGTAILDANVVLKVGKGSYKIELLGENEEVTLVLEAQGGQALSGQGWMVTDGFGDASYRVTATEAEDVEYSIEYVFR
jgi:hypothetical protein